MRFNPRLLANCLLLLPYLAIAQIDIDKTCAACSRLKNDSLNIQVRKIRLNQVGYLPQDENKAAFMADAIGATFSIVATATGQTVFTGALKDMGLQVGPAIDIYTYYNSITKLDELHRPAVTEHLYRADFSSFKTTGNYYLKCGQDTSAHFQIDPKVYNFVFETTMKFFGAQRCGKTDSWFHKNCHLKDGDFLGSKYTGALSGGWHDCGDHIKVAETTAYAAVVLGMTYSFWPEKAEDFYGKSYDDTLPFGTDGVPDVLYESKIGADYILKLYTVSKELGLVEKHNMYHSIIDGEDHAYWDLPEHQDIAPHSKGGPPRTPRDGIGSDVAGMYVATLAFFSKNWEPFDPAYAKTCLAAAKDMYDKLIVNRRGTPTLNELGFYTAGSGPQVDDEALAALALWYVTKDPRYRKDLLEDPLLGENKLSHYNQGTFPTGLLGNRNSVPFHAGGWPTDFQNTHAYTLFGLVKLILDKPEVAATYGLTTIATESLKKDAIAALKYSIKVASGGTAHFGDINANEPYHDMFSEKWGYNRYNMGVVLELFLYWDLTHDQNYYNIGLDNLNYVLGMNPWDISFIMGAGEKNLQHPHNRAANPEGYNAGGFPYPYRIPKGALMGGSKPTDPLRDFWLEYDNTETCIDFSAQILMPTQILAADLPPDLDGPKFRTVNIFPENRSALVTWSTDEISRDTLFLLDAPGGKLIQTLPFAPLARDKQIVIQDLASNTTYFVYFSGRDVRGNYTVDMNNGAFWKFTTKAITVPAIISDVRVCNESHESALVTWWTKNGLYPSQVDYGKTTALGLSQSPDDAGLPTQFHRVTLKDLETATPYFFQAISGSTKDDNGGQYYTFSTTQVLVNYTIRIKPTNRASGGKSTHFYIDVANNEDKPYFGLELRYYFTADATTASGLIAIGYDNQIFDVGGNPHQLSTGTSIVFGTAKQVTGMPDQWYFPITLNDTLPVAGRARFELQINTRGPNNTTGDQPFSYFTNAWSVRPHTQPPEPIAFEGVDLSKGATGVYTDPEMIVSVNGKNELTYTENPYITAYYKGVHVFGYGPDYRITDKLVVRRTASLSLSLPVASPQNQFDLRQTTGDLVLAGKASSNPDGRIDVIVINGLTVDESLLKRSSVGVEFSRTFSLSEGTNVFDIIAWDTTHCAVESRKLIVNWIKAPPLPPPQVAKPEANPVGKAGKDSLVVNLSTATPGANIWYTLDGSRPSPNAPTSLAFIGPILIKNSLTLKAIAVKPDWESSVLLQENYEISKFTLINIRQAIFKDADANGYADAILLLLDTTLGSPNPSIIKDQITGAKLTSALHLSSYRLAQDTLVINLMANALNIVDGVEALMLPRPLIDGDGMLSAGTTAIHDGIAPVIRRAVLRRGSLGTPDSLQVSFSENLSTGILAASPFLALQSAGGNQYAFAIASGKPSTPLENLFTWMYVIQATPAITGGLSILPMAGDSVWINPFAGVSDKMGNLQTNPNNNHVPLRIWTSLVYRIESVAPGGVSQLSFSPTGSPWTVFVGPGGENRIGIASASLPTTFITPDRPHAGGLLMDASHPFALDLHVCDNLGNFVGRVKLELTETDLSRLPQGNLPGTHRLYLIWNGTATTGGPVATGAYVYLWNLTFFPSEGQPRSSAGRRIFGIIRNR
jgi:hypothetical protein